MAEDRMLTIQEVSIYLGIPVKTLYGWRVHDRRCEPEARRGLEAVKLPHSLRYKLSALNDWIDSRKDK